MSDSAVRAAIAMGMLEKMGGFVPLIPLGDGRSLSGWATGPMGRIVSAAAVAKSRRRPFTLDSVTPQMRAPVIVVFVRDNDAKVLGITMGPWPMPGDSGTPIKPMRGDTVDASRHKFIAYFSTAVLRQNKQLWLRILTSNGPTAQMLGGQERKSLQ